MSSQPAARIQDSVTKQPISDREARARVEALARRREQAQQKLAVHLAHLKSTEQQLAEESRQAREMYGTDDPVAIKEKVLTTLRENEADVVAMELAMTEVDQMLAAAEEPSAAPAV